MRGGLAAIALVLGCNTDPGVPFEQVGYRDGVSTQPDSGERGSVKIVEVLWSGSVTNSGEWDPDDIFIELRNEGARPVNITSWQLDLEGTVARSWRMPPTDFDIHVGQHRVIVAKADGCITEPDWVLPDLALPMNDPFRLTLRDADERLIESAGARDMPPFAGGYDFAVSRSMERVELMFGGRGTEPHQWHHYTSAEVDVVNNDRIAEHCRQRTLASPGRPNSPDYSGAFSTGSFE